MKRPELERILIIGAGPIVIGQACEFDYSGTQACKALREVGHRVILVNSNPASIMTDPDIADVTYIEPLCPDTLEKIIARERPQALLPTLGGQTALNIGMTLHKRGVLAHFGVEMLGACPEAIHRAEDRLEFKKAMERINLASARSQVAYSLDEALAIGEALGYPCVVRPAYTLGGSGGGIAEGPDSLREIVSAGLHHSMIKEVLVEESLLGWKEYELEVMRDGADNVVIVCSIENLDPMGIHTGDSITVAPAQTLSDKEYQRMRNAAVAIIREIGVATGGANVQFAVNPRNGRMVVIEMNPRVSRSSALASKATGFPIAKIAAKLAVGYRLDELANDITRKTTACFEPTLDYVVTKIPRFNFDKFPDSPPTLGTAMQSVGEVMAIGRTFKESLQKALRSLETKRLGFGADGRDIVSDDRDEVRNQLRRGSPERLFSIKRAFELGFSVAEIHAESAIDPWFLYQLREIIETAATLSDDEASLRRAKEQGYGDGQLAKLLLYPNELSFRSRREALGIKPVYKLVDTCGGEFAAVTPYYYSTYETYDEVSVEARKKIMILGSGPNRIGQGIEFDYCCVHAAMACKALGYQTIIVNSNPETVSTDFDRADKLYFEPLTLEEVLTIYRKEQASGVIVQFGGQTPLNLASCLEQAGVTLLGTASEAIDRAEDRARFADLLHALGLRQPTNAAVMASGEAMSVAREIGYPLVVRPSYVLGGSAMEIVHEESDLLAYLQRVAQPSPDYPILLDRFLENAVEIDVDALADGSECLIAGMMEHVEEAGVHSGDSACFLPPRGLSPALQREIARASKAIARELKIVGLLNLQFAVCADELYVLEVNPRASRTIPFVSKATGIAWAKMATRVMLGESLGELGLTETVPDFWSVKEAVLPFNRFANSDPQLGPEMRATGEVMGMDKDADLAYYKAQLAAGMKLPPPPATIGYYCFERKIEEALASLAGPLEACGYRFCDLRGAGGGDGTGQPAMMIVISGPGRRDPEAAVLRKRAVKLGLPYYTTYNGAAQAFRAMVVALQRSLGVRSLQEYRDLGSSE